MHTRAHAGDALALVLVVTRKRAYTNAWFADAGTKHWSSEDFDPEATLSTC